MVDDVAEASAAVQALSFAFDTIFVTACSVTFLRMVARDHCDHDGSDDSVVDAAIDDDDDHDSDDDDIDDAASMGDDDNDEHNALLFSCTCGLH